MKMVDIPSSSWVNPGKFSIAFGVFARILFNLKAPFRLRRSLPSFFLVIPNFQFVAISWCCSCVFIVFGIKLHRLFYFMIFWLLKITNYFILKMCFIGKYIFHFLACRWLHISRFRLFCIWSECGLQKFFYFKSRCLCC